MVSDLPTLLEKRYTKTLRCRPPRNSLDLCRLQATYETGVDTVQLRRTPVDPHHQVRWDVSPPSWIKEASVLYWDALLMHRVLAWIVKMKAVKVQRSVSGSKSTVLLNMDTKGLYTKTFSMRPYCENEDGTWTQYHSDLQMKLDKSSAAEYLVRR
ncbi:hypothetical protein SARC_06429 [Sphaeroforma arctica JP610]|uniref:Uncharacterized protein n=1 Tax=Sphaeroforma arctica JP610 TaxID=667725 RepID=A0A0L0FX83_9EUKA|nr:hypothetical protein SARC_06429 [Sphaeroforma arctica JP610]KNC81254.1 hypothetical protein SARC_06429 [Sphaeroforma arctica JP610]|eukprot:XP_014155156.1 hypothetical protein SARC_06429 [Sphaeroforma arctica JP610]